MSFYNRFEALCMKKGLRPQSSEILQMAGVSSPAVTAWKKGSEPKADALVRMAKYFDVSVDYLVGYSDEPTRGAIRSTPDERLLDAFHQLNAEGQDLVLDYVERLTEKPRYTTETAIKVYHAPTAKVPRRIRMTAQQRHLQSAVNRAEVVVGKKK